MANTRRTGSGALVDTVRSTITQITGNRGRKSRGGGGLGAQASGFISGLLSGDDSRNSRGKGRRRR